jgi:hypothetical protein
MKKLLIASGCSFTWSLQQHLKFWPELLAEKLNMDFINLGKDGASNQYIHDLTIDTIYESKNIGLVVSAWSGFDRTISLDCSESLLDIPQPECPFGDLDIMDTKMNLKNCRNTTQSRKYPRYMIEKGIRNMLSLASFCRDKNLPYLQLSSVLLCMPILSDEIAKLMLQYKPFMDLDNQNIIGWPFLQSMGGFNFFEIVDCHDSDHPTQDGHDHVSDIIYKRYGEIYG